MAFPAVTLLDALTRVAEESPISKGGEGGLAGEWKPPSWVFAAGDATTTGWDASVNTKEYGVYWHTEMASPALRIEGAAFPVLSGEPKDVGLWVCLGGGAGGAPAKTGYRLLLTVTALHVYTIELIRYDAGVPTQLAEIKVVTINAKEWIGLTVAGGKLKYWQGKKGEETVILEAEDGKYTTGYIGFFTNNSTVKLKSVEAKPQTNSYTLSASDSLSIAESTTRVQAEPRSAEDSFSIADIAARTEEQVRSPSDVLAIAEVATRTEQQLRTPTDSLSLTEGIQRIQSQPRAAADAVAIAESVKATHGVGRSGADSLSIAEALARVQSQTRTAGESFSIAEVATRVSVAARQASDTLTIEEAISVIVTKAQPGTAQLSITPTSTATIALSPVGTAQLGVSAVGTASIEVAPVDPR